MAEEYREQLPDDCPPGGAKEISDQTDVYRLVRNSPATEDDFRSQRAVRPIAIFRVGECMARGVSVLSGLTHAENARRLPRLRDTHVCRVKLCQGAGRLMQTGKSYHLTWWPYLSFDILAHCEVVLS